MVLPQSNLILEGDYLGEPLTTTCTSSEGGWSLDLTEPFMLIDILSKKPNPKDKIAIAMRGYYAKNGRLYRKGE